MRPHNFASDIIVSLAGLPWFHSHAATRWSDPSLCIKKNLKEFREMQHTFKYVVYTIYCRFHINLTHFHWKIFASVSSYGQRMWVSGDIYSIGAYLNRAVHFLALDKVGAIQTCTLHWTPPLLMSFLLIYLLHKRPLYINTGTTQCISLDSSYCMPMCSPKHTLLHN